MIDKITLKNAQKRRESLLKALSAMQVKPGWIKYTRSVLGMTLKELAERVGLALPTVAQAERRESEGKITIETLSKLAHAMECELVYAFVPKDDVTELLRKKAIEKARRTILKADSHMSLENQKVTEELQFRIEILAEKLLEKGKVW